MFWFQGAFSPLPGPVSFCLKAVHENQDGSLTVQDPLWMMIGATVGLLCLKLCTKRGLLPLAALPLTQGCHVETLQPNGGGVCVYVCVWVLTTHMSRYQEKIRIHTDKSPQVTNSAAAIWAKANNELYVFLQQLLIQTLVAGYKGDGGPVYNGISWSRHCHNNVEHHILSIHTVSNRTALSHKSPIQLLY